tara:strand:+ start:9 stop:365 length:357 start_codon:yes stop_codon:yes gene_type:complete
MATLNTTVKLSTPSSVAGVLSMDFTNTQAYTIGDVAGDDLSFSGVTEIVATTYGATAYVYIVNTHGSNHITLSNSAGNAWGVVEANEWAFFAVPNSTGLKVTPSAGTIVANYVIMKKA